MSERQRKIVADMEIRPNDRILEIGCGQGVAATYICQKLDGGSYLAIDRSEKMIQTAKKRNARFIESGMAEFLAADMEDVDLGERRFDKILAVRVGLFYKEPERARRIAEEWLAPGGEISAVFDPMNATQRTKETR